MSALEYFDSDVIFNFLVLQDEEKYQQARKLVLNAIDNNVFTISTLVIQEVGFGLARFGLSNDEIEAKLTFLSSINTIEVNVSHIIRALILAKRIGFKHINDCVHTAVAEELKPNRFYTYNKSDFKRIQGYTNLELTIL